MLHQYLLKVQIKLPTHLQNLALIRKTVVTVIADDDVLVNSETHYFAGINKLPGNGNIFGGWLRGHPRDGCGQK